MDTRESHTVTHSDLLTAREVVEQYPQAALSQTMLRRWARDGMVACVRYPSGRVMFLRSDIEEMLTPRAVPAESAVSVEVAGQSAPGVEGGVLPGQGVLL